MSTAIQTARQWAALPSTLAEVRKASGTDEIGGQRFLRALSTMMARTPELGNCSAQSFAAAALAIANLRLDPLSPGEVYLIPRRMGGGPPEATVQLGYRGLLTMVESHPDVGAGACVAHVVHERDEIAISLEPASVRHVPSLAADRGEMIGAYAVAHLANGRTHVEWMSISELRAHRDRYAAAKSGPWQTAFPEMCRKTVLRRLVKQLPWSERMREAVAVEAESEVYDVTPTATVSPAMLLDLGPAVAELRARRMPLSAIQAACDTAGVPVPAELTPGYWSALSEEHAAAILAAPQGGER